MPAGCSRPTRRLTSSARAACRIARGCLHRLSRGGGRKRAADLAPRRPANGTELFPPARRLQPAQQLFSPRRMLAYTIRESLELMRDPIRLGFALLGTAFLMLIFGFGITTDVNSLTFAVLDRDKTYESRAYLEELRGSPYFVEQPPLTDAARSAGPAEERAGHGHDRDPAGLRPRHEARTADRGRRLDRRRHAVPRRDDPRLSRRRAPAVPLRPCHSRQGGSAARRSATDRGPLSLQPGFRQHLSPWSRRPSRCSSRSSRRS